MLRRSVIVISFSFFLLLRLDPIRSGHGILMTEAEVAMANAAQQADHGGEAKNGNAFVRALKAPFKAISRLFGGGKENDNKLHRLSEKDVKKFEAVGVTRVVDARVAPNPVVNNSQATEVPVNQLSEIDAKLAEAVEHLQRGRVLLNSNQINEAIGELSLATSLNPHLKEAHNLLGVAFESKGMRDRAFKSFEVALRGDDDDPEHLNNLGYLHYKNGNYDQAAKFLKRAVKLAPDQQRYWNNLGLVQVQREKFDDAYKSFEIAVGALQGHMNVANRLQALGYDKEAIKHLEAMRALQPNVAIVLLRLANLYTRTGKPEQAEEARRELAAVQSLAEVQPPQN